MPAQHSVVPIPTSPLTSLISFGERQANSLAWDNGDGADEMKWVVSKLSRQ